LYPACSTQGTGLRSIATYLLATTDLSAIALQLPNRPSTARCNASQTLTLTAQEDVVLPHAPESLQTPTSPKRGDRQQGSVSDERLSGTLEVSVQDPMKHG